MFDVCGVVVLLLFGSFGVWLSMLVICCGVMCFGCSSVGKLCDRLRIVDLMLILDVLLLSMCMVLLNLLCMCCVVVGFMWLNWFVDGVVMLLWLLCCVLNVVSSVCVIGCDG